MIAAGRVIPAEDPGGIQDIETCISRDRPCRKSWRRCARMSDIEALSGHLGARQAGARRTRNGVATRLSRPTQRRSSSDVGSRAHGAGSGGGSERAAFPCAGAPPAAQDDSDRCRPRSPRCSWCTADQPTLRTLGAIHVASAQTVSPELRALVTYHLRMAGAAQALSGCGSRARLSGYQSLGESMST